MYPQLSLECTHTYHPTVAHHASIGFDIYAPYNNPLSAYSHCIWHSGLLVKHIPDLYWLQILGKSSLAAQGIGILGGVIDADFRGEIAVIMCNYSDKEMIIEEGSPMAQIVIHTAHLPIHHMRVNSVSLQERKPYKQRGKSAGVWDHAKSL